jgi:(p)ppGpp synthase/HD superfamily hydrolase
MLPAMTGRDRPPYTEAYLDALQYAATLHVGQLRKETAVPYVSHLLAVSALVWEAGGDEEQAIAALLHDAVEDQGGEPRLREIRKRYGKRVAKYVRACTDSMTTDPAAKEDWFTRKQHHLETLGGLEPEYLLVPAADKVHNASAIVWDLEAVGPQVWQRFRRGPAEISWYYLSTLDLLREKRPDCVLTLRLQHWVDRLVALAATS